MLSRPGQIIPYAPSTVSENAMIGKWPFDCLVSLLCLSRCFGFAKNDTGCSGLLTLGEKCTMDDRFRPFRSECGYISHQIVCNGR